VQLEFAEVIERVEVIDGGEGVGLFDLVVETEIEVGCFRRGRSLGRTCGVGVERVQH
jgi:hypothetical protein